MKEARKAQESNNTELSFCDIFINLILCQVNALEIS